MKRNYSLWVSIASVTALIVLVAFYAFLNRDKQNPTPATASPTPSLTPTVSPASTDESPSPSPSVSPTTTSAAHKANAKAAYESKNYAKAISEYTLAIAATNDAKEQADLYNLLGNSYRDNKQADKAITSYQKATSLDASLIPAYVNLSNLYVSQNNKDAARKVLSDGLKANPKNQTLELELSALNLSGTEGE